MRLASLLCIPLAHVLHGGAAEWWSRLATQPLPCRIGRVISMGGTIDMIRIYRFGTKVAINPEVGPTGYWTPTVAREVATALNAYADDIGTRGFTDSTLGTTEIEWHDEV